MGDSGSSGIFDLMDGSTGSNMRSSWFKLAHSDVESEEEEKGGIFTLQDAQSDEESLKSIHSENESDDEDDQPMPSNKSKSFF